MLWFVLFSESGGAEGQGIRNRKRGSEHDNSDPQTRSSSSSQYVGCAVNLETLTKISGCLNDFNQFLHVYHVIYKLIKYFDT